jgi:CubicO group peptidase (beta-lactamase class C family)
MARALSSILIILAFADSLPAQLEPASPSAEGISQAQLERASGLIQAEVGSGRMGAAALLVARQDRVVLHEGFGHFSSAPDAPIVRPDSVFLLASISKPITACALMLLVERGRVALGDPVNHYLPEFTGGERDKVLVRDLLRHTSGLPDMLPENIDLRRAHAPLSEFVRHSTTTPLLFPPGSQFRYQSMGILLAAEIVERVTGTRLPDFEKKEIFDPLGMQDSSLGLGGRRLSDLVICLPTPGTDPADDESFGLNSLYWRDLGSPWGGVHSTTTDLAILLQTFLDGGVRAGKQVFSTAMVKAMTSDQNVELHAPWGLGWALGRSRSWNAFGDLVSGEAFGHTGATGTMAWADPETQLLCVILTNRPYSLDDGRFLRLVSNAVAASVQQFPRERGQLPTKQGKCPY